MARIWMLLATLMLAACDNPDDASQAPAVQANDEQISEAVEEASRHSGEQADESADCGPLEWLLDRLPEQVEGLSQTYRGCESPVTALVLFEDGKRSRMASITVLDPALAGLDDSGSGQWAQLLSDTRKGVLRAIAEQVPFTQVQDDEPQPTQPVQIVLEDGTGAILFSVDGVWELLGIVEHDYAIKFVIDEPEVTTTEQARERVMPMLERLNLPLADRD